MSHPPHPAPPITRDTVCARVARTPRLELQEFVLPPGFRAPPHAHAPPHVLVLLDGWLSDVEGDDERRVEREAIRYSPGGDRHHVVVGPHGAHCVVLEARVFPELRLTARRYVDAPDACDRVRALRRALFEERHSSPAAVEAAALELFRLVRDLARDARVLHHHWLEGVRAHLDAAAVDEVMRSPLAVAARVAGRTPGLVARAFRASYGVSVQHYARRRQLDVAWTLLRTSTRSLGAVAAEARYTDQSHMTRVFVREVGCTPARLRERFRRDPATTNWWLAEPLVAHDHDGAPATA